MTAHFGAQLVPTLSWGDTMKYREQRVAAGRKPATVNYELAILRRMLRLAVKHGKLATVPVIETPPPKNARTGFFERDEFEAVLAARDKESGERVLPESYAAVARFAYCTGWRARSEVLPLQWPQVDFAAGEIRLDANSTKSGKARVFTFDVWPELAELLKARRAATDAVIRESGKRVPWVFHEGCRRIPYKKLLAAWRAAFIAGELAPRLLHDLRRTAARNFRRAGVDEGTIMDLCGWETRAMFDRYNIIDQRDRRAAVEKRAGASELQSSDNPAESPA